MATYRTTCTQWVAFILSRSSIGRDLGYFYCLVHYLVDSLIIFIVCYCFCLLCYSNHPTFFRLVILLTEPPCHQRMPVYTDWSVMMSSVIYKLSCYGWSMFSSNELQTKGNSSALYVRSISASTKGNNHVKEVFWGGYITPLTALWSTLVIHTVCKVSLFHATSFFLIVSLPPVFKLCLCLMFVLSNIQDYYHLPVKPAFSHLLMHVTTFGVSITFLGILFSFREKQMFLNRWNYFVFKVCSSLCVWNCTVLKYTFLKVL